MIDPRLCVKRGSATFAAMGDYVRIYRSFSPKAYYLKIFNADGYEYMWKSGYFRWLWLAKWHGVWKARKYLATDATQIAPQVEKITSFTPSMREGLFEARRKENGGTSVRIFIEQVEL